MCENFLLYNYFQKSKNVGENGANLVPFYFFGAFFFISFCDGSVFLVLENTFENVFIFAENSLNSLAIFAVFFLSF